MNIKRAANIDACPVSRRQLLAHLWAVGLTDANVFKEGAFWTITTARRIAATHWRRLDTQSFASWEQAVRTAGTQFAL